MKLDIQKFASGTIVFDNWSSGSQIRGKIEWTSTPISGQNKSSVYGEIYVRRTSSSTKGRTWNGYLEIGGNVHNFSEIYTHTSTTVGTSWVLLEYFTDTITHNADGTKSIWIGGSVTGPSGTTLSDKSSWGGSNVNLDRLHAAPVLNSVSFTEQNQTLLNLGVSNNQFVPYLSKKNISMNMTLSNSATLSSINWRFKDVDLTTLVTTSILSTSETPPSDTGTFTYTKQVDLANVNIPYTQVSNQYYTKIGYSIVDNLTASFTTSDSNMEIFEVIPYRKPILNASTTTVKRDGQTSGKVNLNINGTFFNGALGNTQNNIQVYYKFWEKTASEPSTYIQIPSASITKSDNNFSVSSYAIGSTSTSASNYFDYQKSYYVAVKVVDTIGIETSINDLSIPVGEATWSEYPDHVDFKKLTIQGNDISSGVILYDNPNGSNGNITLSDSAANYNYLTIFYRSNDNYFSSLCVANPNGKSISLLTTYNNNSSRQWLKSSTYLINGTSLTKQNTVETSLNNSAYPSTSQTSNNYITKVVGSSEVIFSTQVEADTEDYYQQGDTFEIGSTADVNQRFVTNGFISSGTTQVYFSIPTTKSMKYISSITCNILNVEARGGKGYLNNEAGYHDFVGRSGYTITCGKASDNVISVVIVKSSSWSNVDNNTLISMAGQFKFTFIN